MVEIREVEITNRYTVEDIKNILEQLKEVNVLHLRNCMIDIKVVKIDVGVPLYLVFGEHYILRNECHGNWDNVVFITDNLDDLAFYINSL